MNEKETSDAEEATDDSLADQALALELEFVPEWARKPPDQAQHYADKPGRSQSGSRDRDRRDRPGSRDRDGRDRPGKGRQRRRPQDRKEPGPGRRPEQTSRESKPVRPAVVPLPPVDVRFLPDQRQLAALLKKIRLTGRAYPLVKMASLFLSNPTTCDVRIEVRPGTSDDVNIVQCGKCGIVAMERASLLAHIADVHTADYFEKEEQILDPPSGTFVCIARCGLSGVLLGPPNHHSFEAKAREVQRARYPNMPFAEYKDKCEQVHDQDLIEKWKEETRKQTVYRMQSSPEAEPMTRHDAATYIAEHVAPDLISGGRRRDVNAAVAKEEIKDPGLRAAVNAAWRRESAFPKDLSGALRGACRHGHLYVFRSGRGRQVFVSATRPVPMDRTHVVELIRDALVFIEGHPNCSRKDLLEALCPGSTPDSPDARNVLSQLSWLIERGHIVEFFDNSLAVPLRAEPLHKDNKRRKRRPGKPANRPARRS